ncbi:MAG: thrombospondin type 3 repeat-containing protein [Vicinamibacterales bacterium]
MLTGLTMSPQNPDTSLGDVNVTVTMQVTDDQSGVNLGTNITQWSLGMSSPPGFNFGRGCGAPQLTAGDRLNGTWTSTCYFPRYSQAGDWKVEVGISDAAGNYRLYKQTCEVWETNCVLYPTGDPAFPDTTVHLTSTPSDITLPTITSISFAPNFIDTSLSDQEIEIHVHASDDISGFGTVQLTFKSPSGSQTQTLFVSGWQAVSGDALNGEFVGTGTFPRYAEAGTWLLQELFYYDNVFNYKFVGDTYDPNTGIYHTGAENIAALGFPTVLNVVKASLTGDGLIDPALGGDGGGTVVDNAFGDRAQITLPPDSVTTATDVTIDVLESPLTLPDPTGFAGAASYYVNFQFNPYPSMPLPAPGATITLPLTRGLALGTPIGLFRVEVDPNTGQAFLQQSLDVNGDPVIGYAGPPPVVMVPVSYTHPIDVGSSEVDAITPDLLISRDSEYWDGYDGYGVYNQGADIIEWAHGTCAAPVTPFYGSHDDLLASYVESLPGGVAGALPGSDQCLRDTTTGIDYDIHWITWEADGTGGFSYQRTQYTTGSGPVGCDESGCMSVTFYGVAHLSTVVGLFVDTDLDGVADVDDVFPNDSTEWADSDFDGIGDNADLDDDNDGVLDVNDAFPNDPAESLDTDHDGIGNNADLDDDGDGVLDVNDAFPLDPSESVDTDHDGIGNNADTDDDGDGVLDVNDAFPLNPAESVDTDHDGIGNNADLDDDNDGVLDVNDAFPLDPSESVDTDHDGIGNNADLDDDGDGVLDVNDAFPLNPAEWVDTDHDGIGNNADTDDDGDGVLDVNDAFPLDPSESVDTDHDGIGNNADPDDDNDGVLDTGDQCPLVAGTVAGNGCPVNDVSASVTVTRGGFRKAANGRFQQSVTIKNVSATAFDGPVSLVFGSLSSNASLFGGTGVTACAPPAGQPYIDIAVGADNKLTPGESAAIVLEFTNPSNAAITYTTRVIAGPGCR